MDDWIDTFMHLTDGLSPRPFRLWAAITTISSILERRVWMFTDKGILFPNMYTILAGAPASGKSLMVSRARNLLSQVNGLYLAPDNPTKPTFLDALEAAVRIVEPEGPSPKLQIYASMAVMCAELGVLLSDHDTQFMADLTHIYDNPDKYDAPRRSVKSTKIENPTVNILAAVTPDFLGDILPEQAWGQGFASRLIFIYGAKSTIKGRNAFIKRKEGNYEPLVKALNAFFNDLYGEFTWDEDAQDAMNAWLEIGQPPEPDHNRLTHYNGRREAHTFKLGMISAVSAGRGLFVSLADFERAKHWLLEAETRMPDVFRSMGSKSDVQLLDDLHFYIWNLFASKPPNEREPITDMQIVSFLEDKITAERIQKIIGLMELSERMKRGPYPGTWIPRSIV